MHQRYSNDTGPTQQPTHVDITFVLVRAHDLAPMQQRSNNEPGPNQHSKHVNITFGISESMIQHRCSNDPTTIQDGCSNSQLLILHWLKLKHTIQHRCNSVPTTIHDRTSTPNNANITFVCMETWSTTDAATIHQRSRAEPAHQNC